ncbi:MAG: hypothetical protein KFW21_04215 [Spirochaetota bacterium]|nr:hypothetical protein [Spirochaetota bacterium]
MFDILACILLFGIVVVLFQIGKMMFYHLQLIQKFMMTRNFSLKIIIEYITQKLKQFLRFLRKLFSSKRGKKLTVDSRELIDITHQLEIINLEV